MYVQASRLLEVVTAKHVASASMYVQAAECCKWCMQITQYALQATHPTPLALIWEYERTRLDNSVMSFGLPTATLALHS